MDVSLVASIFPCLFRCHRCCCCWCCCRVTIVTNSLQFLLTLFADDESTQFLFPSYYGRPLTKGLHFNTYTPLGHTERVNGILLIIAWNVINYGML